MEESVAAFLDHITQQRELSANTRAAYKNDLTQLTKFLREQGAQDWRVDRARVGAFVQNLMDRGYSSSTRARKVAAVRSFYRYLCEQGIVDENPTQDIVGTHVERMAPTVLTHDQGQSPSLPRQRRRLPRKPSVIGVFCISYIAPAFASPKRLELTLVTWAEKASN